MFAWDEGEKPGDAPGCRCSADPVTDGEGKEPAQNSVFNPTPEQMLDMALLVASLIPYTAVAARAALALRRVGRIGEQISKMAERLKPASPKPTAKPEPKPIAKPSLRRDYEKEVRNLEKLERQMKRQGKTNEEIARELSRKRREIGEKYKELTPKGIRDKIFERNREKYGDKLGPSIDDLRNQGKTWEEIIESSKRPGGGDLF